jgi:hypothetical protein
MPPARIESSKSFLVLFFKKELLSWHLALPWQKVTFSARWYEIAAFRLGAAIDAVMGALSHRPSWTPTFRRRSHGTSIDLHPGR